MEITYARTDSGRINAYQTFLNTAGELLQKAGIGKRAIKKTDDGLLAHGVRIQKMSPGENTAFRGLMLSVESDKKNTLATKGMCKYVLKKKDEIDEKTFVNRFQFLVQKAN